MFDKHSKQSADALVACVLSGDINTETHTHTHAQTHAQTHIGRCWIVLNQPTYTDDFCHQAEHSYIAGPCTPL